MIKFAARHLVLAFLLLNALSASSDTALKSADQIVGKWKLVQEAGRLDGPRRESDQSWEFRADGVLESIAQHNAIGGNKFKVSVNYRVENGKIISDYPGRPGRTIVYTVIKNSDNEMVLEGGTGGFLFFTK